MRHPFLQVCIPPPLPPRTATAMAEHLSLLSRIASMDNAQPGAILDVLTLLLNVAHVNLVAASDQASVLHARMFQAAVSVVTAWSSIHQLSSQVPTLRLRVVLAATQSYHKYGTNKNLHYVSCPGGICRS